MSSWTVDGTGERGVLRLKLDGALTLEEMSAFVEAHNRAVNGFHDADYRVWCDISRLSPMRPDCAALFESAKRHSSRRPNFRGSSVLVSSAMVALQHRRTSIDGGVMETELISDDEAALREHLRTVYRRTPSGPSGPSGPSASKPRRTT
jgi:hypothetical protein